MKLVLACSLLLASFGLSAQSEISVSGDALVSGAADTQIRGFARTAAAKNQTISVSAPNYWHDLIREQLDAAAPAAKVVFTDVFNEIVILRAEANVAPVAPTPPVAPEPPAPVVPVAPKPPVAPLPPPAIKVPDVSIAKPAPTADEMVKPNVPPVAPSVDAPPVPEVVDPGAARRAAAIADLSKSLNEGEAIASTLKLAGMQYGDRLIVRGDVVAVVRSGRLRREFFILEEPLGETNRPELLRVSDNTFDVQSTFSTAREVEAQVAPVAAPVLSAADELARFERGLNRSKPFADKFTVADLRSDDVLYVGKHYSVVLRASRIRLARYLIEGKVDISTLKLEQQASNRYKVLDTPR